jgi:hypothetical protein
MSHSSPRSKRPDRPHQYTASSRARPTPPDQPVTVNNRAPLRLPKVSVHQEIYFNVSDFLAWIENIRNIIVNSLLPEADIGSNEVIDTWAELREQIMETIEQNQQAILAGEKTILQARIDIIKAIDQCAYQAESGDELLDKLTQDQHPNFQALVKKIRQSIINYYQQEPNPSSERVAGVQRLLASTRDAQFKLLSGEITEAQAINKISVAVTAERNVARTDSWRRRSTFSNALDHVESKTEVAHDPFEVLLDALERHVAHYKAKAEKRYAWDFKFLGMHFKRKKIAEENEGVLHQMQYHQQKLMETKDQKTSEDKYSDLKDFTFKRILEIQQRDGGSELANQLELALKTATAPRLRAGGGG